MTTRLAGGGMCTMDGARKGQMAHMRQGALNVARGVTAATLSLAVLSGSAFAAPTRVAKDQGRVSAIALHGDEVLWTANARLFRRGADGVVRTVRRVEQAGPVRDEDDPYASGSEVVRLEAGASAALVVERAWDELASKLGDDAMGSETYLVDLAGGGRATVESCGTWGDAAVAGTLVITSGCAGSSDDEETGAVRLRDLARPDESPRRLAGEASAVRVAGRVVGWLSDRTITVMDADSGSRRDIDIAPYVAAGTETPVLWDLDADGSVALASPAGVILAAADGTPPRTLAVPGEVIRLAYAAGRVAVSVQRSSYFRSDGLHQVMTLAPDGAARVLAAGGYNSTLDADGDHLAYTSLACIPERHDVWLQRTDDTPTADLSRTNCRLPIEGRADVSRRGRVKYSLACPSLVPSLRGGQRCSIAIVASVGRFRLGTRRATASAMKFADFKWRLPDRLRGTRRMRVAVTVKMRGRTMRRSRMVRLDRN